MKVIQFVNSSVDGLYSAIATKLCIDKDTELITISGSEYIITKTIEGILESMDKNRTFGIHENYGYSLLDIDGNIVNLDEVQWVSVIDISLKKDIIEKLEECNRSRASKAPVFLYIKNNTHNLSNVERVSTYPGHKHPCVEKWLAFVIDQVTTEVPNLKAFDKIISTLEYAYALRRGRASYDRTKDTFIRQMKSCISFYGFTRFVDIMTDKMKTTGNFNLTKNESYVAYNFEKHLVKSIVSKISNPIYFNSNSDDDINISIIDVDYSNKWILNDAMEKVNKRLVKDDRPVIDILIAIDPCKDVVVKFGKTVTPFSKKEFFEEFRDSVINSFTYKPVMDAMVKYFK